MNTFTKIVGAVMVISVIVLLVLVAVSRLVAPVVPVSPDPVTVATSTPKLVGVAQYVCDAEKTIQASFYETAPVATHPGEPPIPGGSVQLLLHAATGTVDTQAISLVQTISADGARYANADESFVFWSKGNGALVLENNEPKNYTGCIVIKPDALNTLTEVYHASAEGVTLRYPADYAKDAAYQYQVLGPGKTITGVKFTIPDSIATGTNLSRDSYISLESIASTSECSAGLFLERGIATSAYEDGDMAYSFATSTGAAMGNRYEETIYAFPYTNPCIAVRYFVHYTVLENYPEGAVKQFDRALVQGIFDQVRKTVVVNQ